MHAFDAATAARFSEIALANVTTEYPNKLDHVIVSAADLRSPQALHPVFYGSYDWHSAVHMHWLLLRALRLHPQLPQAPTIKALLDVHFQPERVQEEIAYLARPNSETFERPYGWAWLLALQCECLNLAQDDPAARAWSDCLAPLADGFAHRFLAYLPKAEFPMRGGTHGNTAFALLLSHAFARRQAHGDLEKRIAQKAVQWYGADQHYPARLEPSSDDFLSGGLVEAALMGEILERDAFTDWWSAFHPLEDEMQHWLRPVEVTDPSDAKLVHLAGLSLSRAWCWRLLENKIPVTQRATAQRAIGAHLDHAMPLAVNGHYVGTHWLASFATLALTGEL